jgi:hypothetical protein
LPLPFLLFDVLGEEPTCPGLSSTLAGEPFSFALSLELDRPALKKYKSQTFIKEFKGLQQLLGRMCDVYILQITHSIQDDSRS